MEIKFYCESVVVRSNARLNSIVSNLEIRHSGKRGEWGKDRFTKCSYGIRESNQF